MAIKTIFVRDEKISASRRKYILNAYKNFFVRVEKNKPFHSDFNGQMNVYSHTSTFSYLCK